MKENHQFIYDRVRNPNLYLGRDKKGQLIEFPRTRIVRTMWDHIEDKIPSNHNNKNIWMPQEFFYLHSTIWAYVHYYVSYCVQQSVQIALLGEETWWGTRR